MRSLAATLLLASAACAAPQFYYAPGYGSYGLEVPYQPMPLFEFRYSQNPLRTQTYRNFNSQNQQGFGRSIGGSNQQNQQFTQQFNNQNQQFNQRNQQFNQQTFNSAFGNFASNGITEEQRQLYLPVMRALLKVMQTDRPSARDINTLMVETRDLNKKVPKGQNLLGNFANFGIDGLESMGLPEFGDIIENVDGIPHIRTTWGSFPLSDTSLMTPAERSRFIKPVTVFTNVLEKGNADANEVTQLMQYAQELMRDMNVNGNNFNFGDFNNQNQQFNQERSFNNQNQRFNNQNQRFNNQRNQQFNNQRNQQFRDYN